MKKTSLVVVLFLSFLFGSGQSNIYSFKVDSVSGSTQIDFAAFEGKKILIVNTATADSCTSQFAELEQLYQLYHDSLVIVAVSSNSFNTEPRTNAEIANYCSSNYNIHFVLSAKIEVTGTNADTLYKWLTQKTLNTMLNNTIRGSFQKFLINKQGKLMGYFNRRTSPMSSAFRHAIEIL